MTRRDLDCEEALGRLFEFLDHELDAEERDAMQFHLSRCRSCFSRANFEQRLQQRLRELRAETDTGASERIERLLQSF